MENLKEEFKEKIKSNIEQYGHHNTIVHSGTVPRFAYTIGLKKHFEIELIFAGGIYFMQDEIMKIINGIAVHVKQFGLIDNVAVSSFGLFKLSRVHQSWSKLTALGCFDFYNTNEIQLYQIIPDTEHFTLDIPNMSLEWNSISQPIWKWLSEK